MASQRLYILSSNDFAKKALYSRIIVKKNECYEEYTIESYRMAHVNQIMLCYLAWYEIRK